MLDLTYRTAAFTQLAISLLEFAGSILSDSEIHTHTGGKKSM
jgi:hypothetical protein